MALDVWPQLLIRQHLDHVGDDPVRGHEVAHLQVAHGVHFAVYDHTMPALDQHGFGVAPPRHGVARIVHDIRAREVDDVDHGAFLDGPHGRACRAVEVNARVDVVLADSPKGAGVSLRGHELGLLGKRQGPACPVFDVRYNVADLGHRAHALVSASQYLLLRVDKHGVAVVEVHHLGHVPTRQRMLPHIRVHGGCDEQGLLGGPCAHDVGQQVVGQAVRNLGQRVRGARGDNQHVCPVLQVNVQNGVANSPASLLVSILEHARAFDAVPRTVVREVRRRRGDFGHPQPLCSHHDADIAKCLQGFNQFGRQGRRDGAGHSKQNVHSKSPNCRVAMTCPSEFPVMTLRTIVSGFSSMDTKGLSLKPFLAYT